VEAGVADESRAVLDRPARPPDLTLRYGSLPDQVIDVRLPPAPAGAPLMIFLHGGFWRQEYDRTHTGPLAQTLAGAGLVVATPEYRRTGGAGGWPAPFDDVAAAVRETPGLLRSAGVGFAPGIILAGHSAGGHLALWAAPESVEPVAGVVALAPVADLALAYELDLDRGAVAALVGGGPDEVPDRYAAADPVRRVPLGVRVEIVHGRRDRVVPVTLSRRLAETARLAGDIVGLDEPDCDHFAVIDPDSSAWSRVVAAIERVTPGVGTNTAHVDAREDSE
jgi:acetyl esterase/lipase